MSDPDRSSRLSEHGLIARYFAPIAGEGGLGLIDDGALIAAPPERDLVLTADALVAGVHFFADDPPGSIARKALRVNLSDLAAKGADPLGFLLTLALPNDWTEPWLAAFAVGLVDDAASYACPLLGGDTVATPGPLTLSITALGTLPAGRMVRRAGAKIGDAIAVTGTIGDGALGLVLRREGAAWSEALGEADRGHLLDRYLHPRPRNALAAAVRDHAHAAMDVSDGLVGDLGKLLDVSRVSGVVDIETVPLSRAARAALARDAGLIDVVLTGGDDYEIVMTLSPADVPAMNAMAQAAGVLLAVIGEVTAPAGPPVFRDRNGPCQFARGAFGHF